MNNTNEKFEKETKFIRKLLNWYSLNNRNYFFWRKTKNPYYILASEMMLQKTTTKQVQKIVKEFINRFPSSKKLAEASFKEIEELITPLGIEHKRAKRLKESALLIEEKYAGKVPKNETDLLILPGVGQYIANAVLCLAYGKQVPLLDTNIVRILERIFEIKSDKSRARTDKKLWNYVAKLSQGYKARDVNLALLDFGALVCSAKKPKCLVCPIKDFCAYIIKKKIN